MALAAPPDDRVALLRAVPLLSELSQPQLERVAATGAERRFLPGETIVRQGEKGSGLYLLLQGTVEVRQSGQKVASLVAGQFFGEAALLVEEPRTADAFATSDVACLVVSRWDFWSAVGIDPTADRALFEKTVERLRSFRGQLVE